MSTNDGFDQAYPPPSFLVEMEQQGIATMRDEAVATSRFFRARTLIAAAIAIGIAALFAGDPVALFADVTASLVGNSQLQPGTDPSTSAIRPATDTLALSQSTVDAQASKPATDDTPARDEVAASEPAGKDQTENSEAPPEALFRQFQAWAAEQNAHAAPARPVQDLPAQVVPAQDVQNGPAPAAENERARAPNRLVQKRRPVRAVHDARAEIRAHNVRRQVRPPQNPRAERPPVQPAQDARAQAPPMQDPQASSFPTIFGQRN